MLLLWVTPLRTKTTGSSASVPTPNSPKVHDFFRIHIRASLWHRGPSLTAQIAVNRIVQSIRHPISLHSCGQLFANASDKQSGPAVPPLWEHKSPFLYPAPQCPD